MRLYHTAAVVLENIQANSATRACDLLRWLPRAFAVVADSVDCEVLDVSLAAVLTLARRKS